MKKLLPVMVLLLSASVAFAQDKRYTVPIEGSPVLGPANAPVTIIEFLDFQ
jgi:protein-disulfide isomerase